jgi:hypothetical protein
MCGMAEIEFDPEARPLRSGIDVKERGDGLFEVVTAIRYDIGRKNSGLRITVPKRYACDKASIPWFIQWLIPRFGAHDGPAIVHDWLYNTHLTSKPIADSVFYEAMLVCEVRPTAAWLMYIGVALFGHGAYRQGPARLRERSPEWATRIFDKPALPKRGSVASA